MNGFNKKAFLILAVATIILLIPSFFAAWAEDEGTLGSGIFPGMLSKLFYVLRFPAHVLFWKVFSYNAVLFFTGLVLDCLFFSLLIERIIHFCRYIKLKYD